VQPDVDDDEGFEAMVGGQPQQFAVRGPGPAHGGQRGDGVFGLPQATRDALVEQHAHVSPLTRDELAGELQQGDGLLAVDGREVVEEVQAVAGGQVVE
jgi:hypothetical protein